MCKIFRGRICERKYTVLINIYILVFSIKTGLIYLVVGRNSGFFYNYISYTRIFYADKLILCCLLIVAIISNTDKVKVVFLTLSKGLVSSLEKPREFSKDCKYPVRYKHK